MQDMILNKKTVTGLIILMVLYVIFRITSPLFIPLYVHYTDPQLYTVKIETHAWLEFIHAIFLTGFGVAIGVFLVLEAKRVGYHRTLWFCLGATFGMIALLLFYIFRIYQNSRNSNDSDSKI